MQATLARHVCRERRVDDAIVSVTGAPTWQVDRRRVGQLLGNLLDNATAHGGGATAVRLTLAADRGIIEVDDQGPGVSPDDRPLIFDRFVRGRAAHSRADAPGTGLGLALVTQHATAHGGTATVLDRPATVLDRPGGGARFHIELAACLP